MEFLENPYKLWTSDFIEDKRTVLKLAFAEPIVYERKEGFRTPWRRFRSGFSML
jgi:site-specific DNA recombinase